MEQAIPSLSDGPIGGRFISSNDVEEARAKRDESWKAAYARLGQEPPTQPTEEFDGRSLAEVLAANKIKKQEWEEKSKLANQFRALEEDEIMFLDSIRERQEAEERQRQQEDGEEVKGFKEAVAARVTATNPPPSMSTSRIKPPPVIPIKKDVKKALKGIIVKKKPKAVSKSLPATTTVTNKSSGSTKRTSDGTIEPPAETAEPGPKRRKTE